MGAAGQEELGQIIRGYQLKELIGVGGFGTVYKAHQTIVERDVVVKVIRRDLANRVAFVRRFETEARLIARLEHVHIVPLYDYWRDPSGAYLVMRWLRGGSLHDYMLRMGALTLDKVTQVLNQIADALSVAHNQSIIHRDLKPGNILLDEYGNAFLSDFGIAVDLLHVDDTSKENLSYGSPHYLPPEQIASNIVVPQSDVYSLGIMLFELLTNNTPFAGTTTARLLEQQVNDPIPSLQKYRNDLPTALDVVLWRATAKHYEARYASVRALALDFTNAANQRDTIPAVIASQPLPLSSNRKATDHTSPMPSITEHDGTQNLNQSATASIGGKYHTVTLKERQSPRNPYKGLHAFEEGDAGDFYGRSAIIKRLHSAFLSGQRFMAVVGASGSGKSSLVRAGLLPTLRYETNQATDWLVTTLTPGDDPTGELKEALLRIATHHPRELDVLVRDDKSTLATIMRQLSPNETAPILVFIDQFEELFTLVDDAAERRAFLDMLARTAAEPDSRVRLIVTLRADYYDRPLEHLAFGKLLQAHTEVLLPLDADGLRSAIEQPAEQTGLLLEPNLSERILADVGQQAAALPLLQYTMTELYEHRQGNVLPLAAYDAIGGISGALARRAETLYRQLSQAQQTWAQQLFLRLVAVDETQVTRRRALWPQIFSGVEQPADLQIVLDQYSHYRLLTLDRDPETRLPTVEIAHEALLSEWERLHDWISHNRAHIQTRSHLSSAAQSWLEGHQDSGYLARGTVLANFEPLLSDSHLALTTAEDAFLEASLKLRQRSQRARQTIIISLSLLTLVALLLAAYALDRQRAATATATIARARELAALAQSAPSADYDQALLLAVAASQSDTTYEARNALLTTLQNHPQVTHFYHGHMSGVRAVAYHPDGDVIATGDELGNIHLLDATTLTSLRIIASAHTRPILRLQFNVDGTQLLSASEDSSAILWDTMTGDQLKRFDGHMGIVWAAALAPDGSTIATGDESGILRLWNTSTGLLQQQIQAHDGPLYILAHSPDGRLVTGGADRALHLWEPATGQRLVSLEEIHSDWVRSLAFSPDGNYLASGDADGNIVVWDAANWSILSGYTTGTSSDFVQGLAFSTDSRLLFAATQRNVSIWRVQPDGQLMLITVEAVHSDQVWALAANPQQTAFITGSHDTRVIAWDALAEPLRTDTVMSELAVETMTAHPASGQLAFAGTLQNDAGVAIQLWREGTLQHTLVGHVGNITALAFNPDGSQLASVSRAANERILLWDTTQGTLQTTLAGHDAPLLDALYHPDGQHLYSVDADGLVRRWHVATGEQLAELSSDSNQLVLAVAPDGTRLAIGAANGQVSFYDTRTLEPTTYPSLALHDDRITALRYSADGTRLFAASYDGTISLWDVHQQTQLFPNLSGHTDWILDMALSPDEMLLASASRDGTVRLWDLERGLPLGRPFTQNLSDVTAPMTGVAFSVDGSALIAVNNAGQITHWDMRLSHWQAAACAVANRELDEAERLQFFADVETVAICGTP